MNGFPGGILGRAYRGRNDYEAKLEQSDDLWRRRRLRRRGTSRRTQLIGTAVFAVLIIGALVAYALGI